MNHVKTRFAPSPTGFLHIGNVRTALFNVLYARKMQGTFLLRIEDSDLERSEGQFVAALLEDMRWLGLAPDEGPRSAEPDVAFYQSQRLAIYQEYYQRLEMNGLAYPCFCTPRELELSRKAQLSAGKPPRYSGKCAHLKPEEVIAKQTQGLQPTLRFRVATDQYVRFTDWVRGPQQFATNDIGDFIIRRANGVPAFFFCNAIDDALMGVTHVLRGEDHLTNTPRQILLLDALGLPIPQYGHISLILGDDGAPLSKRNGSQSIQEMRAKGYFPEAIVDLLARLGHYYADDSLSGLEDLAAQFQLENLGKSPARFDAAQLKHWQQHALQHASDERLWQWLPETVRTQVPETARAAFLDIVRSNCLFPDDAALWSEVLFGETISLSTEASQAIVQAGPGYFQHALTACREQPSDYAQFLQRLKQLTGCQGKSLFQPLRAALTGRFDGPEIVKIYTLLDGERTQRRFARYA